MEKKISKEQWIEITRKLRNRVQGYFNPEQLERIEISAADSGAWGAAGHAAFAVGS